MTPDAYKAAVERIDKRCLTELDWNFHDAHWVGHSEAATHISIDEFMRAL